MDPDYADKERQALHKAAIAEKLRSTTDGYATHSFGGPGSEAVRKAIAKPGAGITFRQLHVGDWFRQSRGQWLPTTERRQKIEQFAKANGKPANCQNEHGEYLFIADYEYVLPEGA